MYIYLNIFVYFTMSYLAYYSCMLGCHTVEQISAEECRSPVHLQRTSGALSLTSLGSNSCAFPSSPLTLQASPGQTLNITVYDFSGSSADSDGPQSQCAVNHGQITDVSAGSGHAQSVPICAGSGRITHAMVSNGNSVRITLAPDRFTDAAILLQYEGRYTTGYTHLRSIANILVIFFIRSAFQLNSLSCKLDWNIWALQCNLKLCTCTVLRILVDVLSSLSVLGCADMVGVNGATMHRAGNTLTITCSLDQTMTWRRRCVRHEWVGEYGRCSSSKYAIFYVIRQTTN